jgi:hypothetical protein
MFEWRSKESQVNPFMSNELAGEHIRDLRDQVARGRRVAERDVRIAPVTVRRFAERDIDAIQRLAALDEKPIPSGGVLVAEQEGKLVAALPLDGGQALADPFKPTADVVELLKVSARQLREASGASAHHRPTLLRGLQRNVA